MMASKVLGQREDHCPAPSRSFPEVWSSCACARCGKSKFAGPWQGPDFLRHATMLTPFARRVRREGTPHQRWPAVRRRERNSKPGDKIEKQK